MDGSSSKQKHVFLSKNVPLSNVQGCTLLNRVRDSSGILFEALLQRGKKIQADSPTVFFRR